MTTPTVPPIDDERLAEMAQRAQDCVGGEGPSRYYTYLEAVHPTDVLGMVARIRQDGERIRELEAQLQESRDAAVQAVLLAVRAGLREGQRAQEEANDG